MDKKCVMVDGAIGEGGGQVLRSTLALSLAFGLPFCMVNIRTKHPKTISPDCDRGNSCALCPDV